MSLRSASTAPRQAFVTGAGSGIGAAIVARMNAAGYEVIGAHRGPPASGYRHVSLDLSDPAGVAECAKGLARELDRLEAVVLAAGVGRFGSLEEFSPEQIRELLDVDLVSNVLLCRYLVPKLKERGGGRVVLIGSEAGLRGSRQGAVYCAAKFGLRGFAQALRDECASANVRVTIVHPGMVRTPFFDELEFEPGPRSENALTAGDVADAVAYVLNAPERAVVDELELSPRVRVVRRRPSGATPGAGPKSSKPDTSESGSE